MAEQIRLIRIYRYTDYLANSSAMFRPKHSHHMKLRTANAKAALEHTLGDIRAEVAALERDAGNAVNLIAQMTAQKRLTVLQRELRQKEERLYYDCMKLDNELDERMEEFISGGKMSCDIQRQFVLTVTGTKD